MMMMATVGWGCLDWRALGGRTIPGALRVRHQRSHQHQNDRAKQAEKQSSIRRYHMKVVVQSGTFPFFYREPPLMTTVHATVWNDEPEHDHDNNDDSQEDLQSHG